MSRRRARHDCYLIVPGVLERRDGAGGCANFVTRLVADLLTRLHPAPAVASLAGRLYMLVWSSIHLRYSNHHAGWTRSVGERQRACCCCCDFFFALDL